MRSVAPVQVLAVLSSKGGGGKTQVALNLACSLSARGRRVVVLDGNFSIPNAALALGISPTWTLADVVAQRCTLQQALTNAPTGFQMLVGARLGQFWVPTLQQMAGLIHALGTLNPLPDVVLIDCANGMRDDVLLLAQAANERLLITEDDPVSSACALHLLQGIQQRYGVSRFRLLVNKVHTAGEGQTLHERLLLSDAFPERLVLDFSGEIPFDDVFARATQRQHLLCEASPRSRAAHAFRQLAEQVDGWPLPAHPRGNLEFFLERLVEVQSLERKRA